MSHLLHLEPAFLYRLVLSTSASALFPVFESSHLLVSTVEVHHCIRHLGNKLNILTLETHYSDCLTFILRVLMLLLKDY